MIAFLSQKRTLFLSGLAVIVLSIILSIINFKIAGSNQAGIFSHQFSFTKERAIFILNAWGENGRSLFLKTIWLDYLYPIAYAVFFASWLMQILQNQLKLMNGTTVALVLIAPFIGAFFDMVENAYQVVQVLRLAELPVWVFLMTSIVSVIKWSFLLVTLVYLCYFKFRLREI